MGTKAIQDAVMGIVQNWLMEHPALGWGITHPLWSLSVGLLLFFLLWGLLRAIAQITERLWVELLQLPMGLGQWLLIQLSYLFKGRLLSVNSYNRQPSIANDQDFKHPSISGTHTCSEQERQLYEILVRLEHLQKEQTSLLQDIKTLLMKEQEPAMVIPNRIRTI